MPLRLRYDLPAPDGVALARHVNEVTAQFCSVDPTRLVGLGMVPMQDPDAAAAELAAIDRLPPKAAGTYVVGIEGALAAASLIAGGTAAKCPELRIAFSHAAGGFPLMLPRAQYFWSGSWNEEPRVPERAPMPDDRPSPREDPAGRTLRSLELPPAALDDITWNNAFRWLGIKPVR